MLNFKPRPMIGWMLVVVMLMTAACQPVSPIERTLEGVAKPTPAATAETAVKTPSLVGRYTGSLAVAEMELEIVVAFAEDESGYTGAIDKLWCG